MRWLGVALMLASALAGLIGWFVFSENKPVTIGAGVFLVIGLIIFLTAGERKTIEKIENIHTDRTDKKE